MQYKKIIYIIIAFVFVLTITNVRTYALPTLGNDYDEIPDYSGEETYFGKLIKELEDVKKEPKVVYESHWASWFQKPISEDFDSKKYVLYRCEYYFDAPVKDIDISRRLEPNETYQFEEKMNFRYSERKQKINENSVKSFGEFFSKKIIGIELPIDIIKIRAIQDKSFKFSVDWVYKTLNDTTKTFEMKYDRIEPYSYTNNTGEYVFVNRNIRQRYYVMVLCEYELIYEQSMFGSGAFNKDRNYTYKFNNYKCVSCDSFLLPKDNPYLEYSIYIDKGDRIYKNNMDGVIFA